jgi:cell division protease FtsH
VQRGRAGGHPPQRRRRDRGDFTVAIERIVAGLEKKNRVLNEHERTVVAYHEMGHALVAMGLPGTDPVHKISIIPRGVGALGYTIQRPTEDRFLMTRAELENKMAVLLGGARPSRSSSAKCPPAPPTTCRRSPPSPAPS